MHYELIPLPDTVRRWLRAARLGSGRALSRAQVFQAAVRHFLRRPWRDQERLLMDYLAEHAPELGKAPPED
jgi:hypothetical protein